MSDAKEVRYAIPMDLLDKLGVYLTQRPYGEVAMLVRRLEAETIKIDIPLPADNEAQA